MATMPIHSVNLGNGTYYCLETNGVASANIWKHGNPLKVPFTLFLLQVSVVSVVTLFFELLLKPLEQSGIVSHLLGCILLGPSALGHRKKFLDSLFPIEGVHYLKTNAVFAFMFFLFGVGVKMDPVLMLKPGRKAMVIGFSLFFFSTTLPVGLSFMFIKFLPMETSFANSLMYLALLQGVTGFPVISNLLIELKILNTDIGRLALTSAMFSDVFSMAFASIGFSAVLIREGAGPSVVWAIISILALGLSVLIVFRPIIMWIWNRSPEGKPVKERYIFSILVLVLLSGLVSEIAGQHYCFGPLLLGLAVPEGPPLGAALETKLILTSRLLYPMYVAVNGLETNLFKIHAQSLWIAGIVFFFAFIVKIMSAMVPAIYSKTPTQEAFVLGLIVNAKGVIDLLFFSLSKDNKMITEEGFALSILSLLVVTGIVSPLIKYLYDPSSQYLSVTRCTIQHSKRESEFRILTCTQNQESIPTLINLLEVSNATEDSPISVTAMVLFEQVGRTNPLLVPNDELTDINSPAGRIVNALRLYEEHNHGNATVRSFTSISYIETMHDEICQMARDKHITVIIMPFHKQWAIDGRVGSTNRSLQTLNVNVLLKAPCSVGILVDRGILTGSFSVLTNQSLFQVAAVFVGGQDDVESLCYAARMAKHECVRVVVIRFLQFGCEHTRDRKRDSDLINEYRRANVGNKRFEYIEEVVKDGAALVSSLRGLVDCFDLVLVGRQQPELEILTGLEAWKECPELGVIGDMLASPDFESTASVLVLQQQRFRGKLMHRNMQPIVTDRDSTADASISHKEAPRTSESYTLSISVDRT